MRQLKGLLDDAVASSSFDLGHTRPGDDGATYYAGRADEVISAQQLRELIEGRTWQDKKHEMASRARLSVPSLSLARVAEFVRTELDHCVDGSTDRIGHAFPGDNSSGTFVTTQPDGIMRSTCTSNVPDFAGALVRGAALLGSERVARLLAGWANNEPAVFKTRVLLNATGILAEPLSPIDGIRIESLPLSSHQFTFFLPSTKGRSLGDYLARMVITIDHLTAPALFHPSNQRQVQASRATAVPGLDAATICTALSLEADTYVDIAFSWTDFGELVAFNKGHDNAIWSTGQQHYRSHSYTNVTIKPESHSDGPSMVLADDWTLEITEEDLGRTLTALTGEGSDQLRVAASRWQSTKNTRASLTDRFIDLRIALESLYLRDFLNEQSQEMRFRLALFGAWHLGADSDDRRTIRKKLRDAYDRASGAVHLGIVESTQENQDLLSDAQALCRRGALRLIADGEPQDWGNLILGADEPTDIS